MSKFNQIYKSLTGLKDEELKLILSKKGEGSSEKSQSEIDRKKKLIGKIVTIFSLHKVPRSEIRPLIEQVLAKRELLETLKDITDEDIALILTKREKTTHSEEVITRKRLLIGRVKDIFGSFGIPRSEIRTNLEQVIVLRKIDRESDGESDGEQEPEADALVHRHLPPLLPIYPPIKTPRPPLSRSRSIQPLPQPVEEVGGLELGDLPVELCREFIDWSDDDFKLVLTGKEHPLARVEKEKKSRFVLASKQLFNHFKIPVKHRRQCLRLIQEVNNIFAKCQTIPNEHRKVLPVLKTYAAKHKISPPPGGLSGKEEAYYYCRHLSRRKQFGCKNDKLTSWDDIAELEDSEDEFDLVMLEDGFCFSKDELLEFARENKKDLDKAQNPWNRQPMANKVSDIINPERASKEGTDQFYTVKEILEILLRRYPEKRHCDLTKVRTRKESLEIIETLFNNLFMRMQSDRFLLAKDITAFMDDNWSKREPGHILLLKTLYDHIKLGVQRLHLGDSDQRNEFLGKIGPLFQDLDDTRQLRTLKITEQTALNRSICLLEYFTEFVDGFKVQDDSSVLLIMTRIFDLIKARIWFMLGSMMACANYFMLFMRYEPPPANRLRFYMRRPGVAAEDYDERWDPRLWEEEHC